MSSVSPGTELCRFLFRFLCPGDKIEKTFTSTERAGPIAAAPAMPFDVFRGRLHVLGLSNRDIRQLERNDEFMH
jgi:hypothetical protein